MYTGNVWGIALLIAGFLATLIGFQLLLGALLPKWSGEATRVLRERFWVSALTGLGCVIALILAVAVLSNLGGPGKFASGLLVAFGSIPIVGGLGAVSRFVGERMPSPADQGRPWRATLRGGVTCALAFVAPFVGWFFVLPASIVMGLGAFCVAMISPAREAYETPALPQEGAAA